MLKQILLVNHWPLLNYNCLIINAICATALNGHYINGKKCFVHVFDNMPAS